MDVILFCISFSFLFQEPFSLHSIKWVVKYEYFAINSSSSVLFFSAAGQSALVQFWARGSNPQPCPQASLTSRYSLSFLPLKATRQTLSSECPADLVAVVVAAFSAVLLGV